MKIQHLILAPKFELATYFINFWANEYYYWLKRQGYIPIILDAAKDVKANFDPAVRDHPNVFVCGGGHGSEWVVTGNKYDVLIDVRKQSDLDLLKGIFWHTLSCRFGQAKDILLNAGVRTFCGSLEDYVFCFANQNNMADPIAHTFWESENAYDKMLHSEKEIDTPDGEADELASQALVAMYRKKYKEATHGTHKQLLMYDLIIHTHGPGKAGGPGPVQGKAMARLLIRVGSQTVYNQASENPQEVSLDVEPILVPA